MEEVFDEKEVFSRFYEALRLTAGGDFTQTIASSMKDCKKDSAKKGSSRKEFYPVANYTPLDTHAHVQANVRGRNRSFESSFRLQRRKQLTMIQLLLFVAYRVDIKCPFFLHALEVMRTLSTGAGCEQTRAPTTVDVRSAERAVSLMYGIEDPRKVATAILLEEFDSSISILRSLKIAPGCSTENLVFMPGLTIYPLPKYKSLRDNHFHGAHPPAYLLEVLSRGEEQRCAWRTKEIAFQ